MLISSDLVFKLGSCFLVIVQFSFGKKRLSSGSCARNATNCCRQCNYRVSIRKKNPGRRVGEFSFFRAYQHAKGYESCKQSQLRHFIWIVITSSFTSFIHHTEPCIFHSGYRSLIFSSCICRSCIFSTSQSCTYSSTTPSATCHRMCFCSERPCLVPDLFMGRCTIQNSDVNDKASLYDHSNEDVVKSLTFLSFSMARTCPYRVNDSTVSCRRNLAA